MKSNGPQKILIAGNSTFRSGISRKLFGQHGLPIRERIAQPLSIQIEKGGLSGEKLENDLQRILKPLKNYDSILTSKSVHTWFWYKGKPVNYNPKILPRSQDAQPLVFETTGLYGIRKKILLKKKSRIGNKTYFYEVSDEEAIDLDNHKDFEYLEYYVKKNFYRTKR